MTCIVPRVPQVVENHLSKGGSLRLGLKVCSFCTVSSWLKHTRLVVLQVHLPRGSHQSYMDSATPSIQAVEDEVVEKDWLSASCRQSVHLLLKNRLAWLQPSRCSCRSRTCRLDTSTGPQLIFFVFRANVVSAKDPRSRRVSCYRPCYLSTRSTLSLMFAAAR